MRKDDEQDKDQEGNASSSGEAGSGSVGLDEVVNEADALIVIGLSYMLGNGTAEGILRVEETAIPAASVRPYHGDSMGALLCGRHGCGSVLGCGEGAKD